MAIQFFCVACRQPIEVDDGMANQTVTCPYCRKVVTAPAATDGAIQENPPIASPSDASQVPGPMPYAPQAPQGTNILSWVSLVCISVALVMLVIVFGVQLSIYKGLPPNTTPQEASKLVNAELQNRPGIWLLSIIGSCAAPLLSVICGIIALVRRRPPRWPAITALVICGMLTLIVCMGLVFMMSNAGGKPGG